MIKIFFKKFIFLFSKKLVNLFYTFGFGRFFLEKLVENINYKKFSIKYNNQKYLFYTPNRLNLFRAKTFLTKEPETINWIKKFEINSVFWDVGANVGLYSCFASKERESNTFAFEPSPFNLELLTKNIYVNNLNDKITIIPISLINRSKISYFKMSDISYGGAHSTFSENYSEDGSQIKEIFNFKTLGIEGNDFYKKLSIPKPDYIKIDVDGIEYLILLGLEELLKNVKSILIEVNENFKKQDNQIKSFLEKNNFKLIQKDQSELLKKSKKNSKIFNQIWEKIKT